MDNFKNEVLKFLPNAEFGNGMSASARFDIDYSNITVELYKNKHKLYVIVLKLKDYGEAVLRAESMSRSLEYALYTAKKKLYKRIKLYENLIEEVRIEPSFNILVREVLEHLGNNAYISYEQKEANIVDLSINELIVRLSYYTSDHDEFITIKCEKPEFSTSVALNIDAVADALYNNGIITLKTKNDIFLSRSDYHAK